MENSKLKNLSKEQLINKAKSLKSIMIVFVPIIIALLFFIIKDYLDGKEINWSIITIVICSIGGAISVYPELKKIKEELRERN